MKSSNILLIFVCVGVLIAAIYVLNIVKDPRDAVRARNALNFTTAPIAQFDWTPSTRPAGFRWISSHDSGVFHEASTAFRLDNNEAINEIIYAKQVSAHLLKTKLNSNAIQSAVEETYEEILSGTGYCADFTIVFNAFVQTQGWGVREWGMSFDGFSGKGHAFNEIYSEELSKWIFVDSFYGFIIRDRASQSPLSFLEFRNLLMNDPASAERIVIDELTTQGPPFKSHQALLTYYRDGVDQTFLIMANDGIVADSKWFSQFLQKLPVSLQQLLSIASGIYPKIQILHDRYNETAIKQLEDLRRTLLASLLMLIVGAFVISSIVARSMFKLYSARKDSA